MYNDITLGIPQALSHVFYFNIVSICCCFIYLQYKVEWDNHRCGVKIELIQTEVGSGIAADSFRDLVYAGGL